MSSSRCRPEPGAEPRTPAPAAGRWPGPRTLAAPPRHVARRRWRPAGRRRSPGRTELAADTVEPLRPREPAAAEEPPVDDDPVRPAAASRGCTCAWGCSRSHARSLRRHDGRGSLDELALLDLAEARWRTGDTAGAGEAPGNPPSTPAQRRLAYVIAAEAIAGVGRPAEARGHPR